LNAIHAANSGTITAPNSNAAVQLCNLALQNRVHAPIKGTMTVQTCMHAPQPSNGIHQRCKQEQKSRMPTPIRYTHAANVSIQGDPFSIHTAKSRMNRHQAGITPA
jgi:hypothetical protein